MPDTIPAQTEDTSSYIPSNGGDAPDLNLSTGETTASNYSNLAYGLDTMSAAGGETSIFDSLQNVLTKAVPLTGLSIVNSFANTGIEVANWFGAGLDKLSIPDEVGAGDLSDYYSAHQQGIEFAGLTAGSFIPGMLAVKALKLAQIGELGTVLQRATSLFSGPKSELIDNALAQIKAGKGALFPSIQADKYTAIALGFGDQALQALAWQTATLATMHASPLLDDKSFADLSSDMFYGTLTGAGIGGAIDGVMGAYLFKNAYKSADIATKFAEISTRLGGQSQMFLAGDRAAALVASLDAIPKPTGDAATGLTTNPLEAAKFSKNQTQGVLDAKKFLQQLLPEGEDENLTNSVFDALYKAHQAGGADIDFTTNMLARLAKVSRIDTPTTPAATDGGFYVNTFSAAARPTVSWGDLVTTAPNDTTALLSRRYALRPYATQTQVASFDDAVVLPDGTSVPKYSSVTDAWNSGADLFVDKKLQIHINPDAPNIQRAARPGESRPLTIKEEVAFRKTGVLPDGSKPLTGAPLILNTIDGGVSTAASPVVGDYGAVNLLDKGLQYGAKFSPQSLATPSTTATAPIDANARYVWAALRGIQSGDTIDRTDIPMLEQLYRAANVPGKDFGEQMAAIAERGVTFAGEDPTLPTSSNDMLNIIRQAKDDLITKLTSDPASKGINSEEISRMANVPEDYLSNGLKANTPTDYMIDPAQHSQINHVQLEYDINNVTTQDGQILRGMQDLQYRVSVIRDAAQSAVSRFFGSNWQQFISTMSSSDANIVGAGSKFLAAASGEYNSLAQQMERIGRTLQDWNRRAMDQIAQTLISPMNAIRQNPEAATELGNFIFARRSTAERYSFLPADVAQTLGVSPNRAVLTKSLVTDNKTGEVTWDKSYTPKGFIPTTFKEAGNEISDLNALHTYYDLGDTVAAFERANQQINDARMAARNQWYAANGLNRVRPLGTLYAPPIDGNKYPFFAYVRQAPGAGMTDDSVSIVVAASQKELDAKLAGLRGYSIYYKSNLASFHQVEGDYQYDRNFAQSSVNSELQRQGILNNLFPDTSVKSIIKDYTDFHARQTLRLGRDYIELGNAQLFAELQSMGERYVSSQTSKFGFVAEKLGIGQDNPYMSYLNTALGISAKDNYRPWAYATEKTEAYFNTAFSVVKNAFQGARTGAISFEDASAISQKFGLGNVYGNAVDALGTYNDVASQLPPQRYLSHFVSVANTILSASAIRLDAFQSLIHATSMPILALAEAHSTSRSIQAMLSTELPDGTGRMLPSISKLIFRGVSSFFGAATPERTQLMALLKSIGAIKDASTDYFQLQNELTLPLGGFSESSMVSAIKNATNLGARLTGSSLTEEMNRYVPAYMAWKLFGAEGAGYTGTQLTDNMFSFLNRVHGNFTAAQRPVAFQGPIGQAMGLFQTYQFNVMQQLFRYVGNREAKSIAILAGLQTSLFGMQGLPGFQAINNHIIGNAAGNPAHKDLYSTIPNLLDPKLGNYLLYGAVSNWTNAGLYNRGDINPRQLTVLPINPLDWPAVRGSIAFVGNLLNVASRISQGGSVPSSLLLGLEHNGLSRPLSGLAQLMQGYVTTNKTGLVAVTQPGFTDNSAGWSDMQSIANFGRILGARPLDEAVAMDQLYRSTLYQAKDEARIQSLGGAVRSSLIGNGQLDEDQLQKFMAGYADAGGNITKFGSKIVQWTADTSASVANKVFSNLAKPLNQQSMMIMGGQKLPDYRTQGSTAVTPSLSPRQTGSLPAGAQQAPDGNYYVPDGTRPGRYMRVQ